MSRVAKSENQAEIWPQGLTGNSLSVLFLPIQVTSLGSTGTAKSLIVIPQYTVHHNCLIFSSNLKHL